MSKTSERIRIEWKQNDAVRDRDFRIPETVREYKDFVYGTDPFWQSLTLYRPKGMDDQTLPLIISIHGGGWAYGDKELYQYYCSDLATRGFAVVNFTYRLAPENKFPAQLEDICLACTWVQENAKAYGLDTEQLFMVGDSAGAHLLGLFCILLAEPAYAAKFSFAPPKDFYPTAIALNCGKYETASLVSESDEDLLNDLLADSGYSKEDIDVIRQLRGTFPPLYLMTAAGDFLKDQAVMLAKKLTEEDLPFNYVYYGSKDNQLGHVFHLNQALPDATRCNDSECDFFRRFLS